MSSSNKTLGDLAGAFKRPVLSGFSAVVAFDYYDGPESGLAVYPTGEGVRFKSLGSSETDTGRAFVLWPIAGRWDARVERLRNETDRNPTALVLVPSASVELERLQADVEAAEALDRFIARSPAGITRLKVARVTDEQYRALMALEDGPAGYELASQLIENYAAGRLAQP